LIAIWGSTFMVASMFLFGREVTSRRRIEAERDALLASERTARIEAERASRAKDEFLATLSHELRSPLSAILGWCAVLRHSHKSPGDVAHGIDVIERNARAQSRLVDDLLDVTRMRTGALHLDAVAIALEVPVTAAVEAARPMAAAKSLTLEYHRDPVVPKVTGDADRLEQIATNLIVNAIKFTPVGGRVEVSVSAVGPQAQLVVSDNGEGIDAEFLPQVFSRFKQGDTSRTRRYGGLGLGLAIVDHLVRMHGGEVKAESPGLGQGARFTVRLPRAAEAGLHELLKVRPEQVTDPVIGHALEGIRVLIVDDEADVRAAVSKLLEQYGAVVDCLESGAAIREKLTEFRPDVLLCDIGMPNEDGYSLIRRVRSLPAGEGGQTPAVSLTAHARNEDRSRALASGFSEHLPKPIDVPRLVATIRSLACREHPTEDVATA
jgi:signal transduction histidine kinase/CheY-like chemotaxis protein